MEKKRIKIYIASSWKNQHAVQMLTDQLRGLGFEVISWIENNYGENPDAAVNRKYKRFDFESWVNSKASDKSFDFDTHGSMTCDIFIYLGPAGKDAAAECGMCYGQRLVGRTVPMLGLWAKGEDFGLMRKMFDHWFEHYGDLQEWIFNYAGRINA